MSSLFPITEQNYILRSKSNFLSDINAFDYESESLSHLGPKLWRILPDEQKQLSSQNKFKSKIKTWVPGNCPCRLCKRQGQHVGFM